MVLNWNSWKQTIRCLEHLSGLAGEFAVVVVENGSSDDSLKELKERLRDQWRLRVIEDPSNSRSACRADQANDDGSLRVRDLHLLVSEENRGFAGGCNLGIRHSLNTGCDFIFLLNNDAWPVGLSLEPLQEIGARNPGSLIGVLTLRGETEEIDFLGRTWPGVLFGRGRLKVPHLLPVKSSDRVWKTGYVEGSALLLTAGFCRQAFLERGWVFDEGLFLYCEDLDLSLYAQSLGYHCLMTDAVGVRHVGSCSGGGSGNRLAFYYITRNRVHIARRWLPWYWRCLFHAYYIPSRVVLQVTRLSPGKMPVFWAVINGLWDGYRGVTGKWSHHLE